MSHFCRCQCLSMSMESQFSLSAIEHETALVTLISKSYMTRRDVHQEEKQQQQQQQQQQQHQHQQQQLLQQKQISLQVISPICFPSSLSDRIAVFKRQFS